MCYREQKYTSATVTIEKKYCYIDTINSFWESNLVTRTKIYKCNQQTIDICQEQKYSGANIVTF